MIDAAKLNSIVSTVRRATPPVRMQTRIIAIDGGSGAGKSTLAKQISDALEYCPIVHTDDFASWDNPLNWHPRLIDEVLNPLSKNLPPKYQRYDWDQRQLAEFVTIPRSNFLIIDGVGSARTEFRPYLTFSIFVKTPANIRLQRGIAREGESIVDQWMKWMSEEDIYMKRDTPEQYASLVIDGTK